MGYTNGMDVMNDNFMNNLEDNLLNTAQYLGGDDGATANKSIPINTDGVQVEQGEETTKGINEAIRKTFKDRK